MTEQMKLIEQALAYATFRNKNVERHTKNLIKALGAEMQEVGFESGEIGEKAGNDLKEAFEEADLQKERALSRSKMGNENGDEDEDDGN